MFVEDGDFAKLRAGTRLPAVAYRETYRHVSSVVRISGNDAAMMTDDSDLTVYPRVKRERRWFPEREFDMFVDGLVALPARVDAAQRHADVLSSGPRGFDLEDAFFGFFMNAVSAIESAAFASYAIGAIVTPSRFPSATEQDRRQISARRTRDTFQSAHPRAPLTSVLDGSLRSEAYRKVSSIRNVLAHRASPLFVTRPEDTDGRGLFLMSTHLAGDLDYDPAHVAPTFDEFVAMLDALLVTMAEFAGETIPVAQARWSRG